jgi:hypothetical protein
MRHCLTLVARYYTEERIIEIRGRYGSEPALSFTGQDLRSQVNVRVLPGSIESKSARRSMREIEFIQQNWPGALSPEAAMAALHGGNAESLLKSTSWTSTGRGSWCRRCGRGRRRCSSSGADRLRPG